MAVLYSNNASTTLSASITSAATTLVVASGKGALFPAISGSDYFYITLVNTAGVIEIMKVTARSTDTFTVVRGQDGTSAAAWAAGDRVELRFNKALLDDVKSGLIGAYPLADWNVANPNLPQLINTSTNGVNGVTNYIGMHFPHTSLNYGFQIAGRNDAAYYRTLENGSYTAWRLIANTAMNLYTFPMLDNSLNLDSGQVDKLWATNIGTDATRGTRPANYTFVVNLGGRAASGLQIAASYGGSDNFYVRRGSDNAGSVNGANVWQPWYTLLHSGNYSSYAASASHTHSFDSLTSKTGGTGDYMTTGSFIAQGILRVQNGTADWDSLDLDANGATHIINARGAETGLSFQFDGTERMFLSSSGLLNTQGKPVADSWLHSNRDFVDGTLIQTDINYAVTYGDPFILEIRGNSYGSGVPFDIQYQGYIYSDTIINRGGYSNGTNISGLVAINYNGNLCFWFPRQSYWQGFYVRVYVPYADYPRQRVTSISNSTKPTTAKQVDVSADIRQSLHSGNYTSYSPSLTGSGASGTWSINVSGSSTSVGGYTSDGWLRKVGDSSQFQVYGNTRTIIFRTDGTTNEHGGGGYAYIWYYGSSGDSERRMILNTSGQLWLSNYGWLHDAFASASHTHNYMSADYSRPGGDLNSKLIPGNYGISYTETNRPADWGALIVGRSADVVAQWYLDHNNAFWIRGGNPPAAGGGGVWNSWREVLHSGNYTNYAASAGHTHAYLPLAGGTMTGALTTNVGGTSIFIGAQNVSTSNALRINWHTDSDLNYYIGKRAGAWTQPMDIAFYTGLRYHTHYAYGGHRFYTTGVDGTQAFSIGDGDTDVRLYSNFRLINGTSPYTSYFQFGDNTGWIFRFMTNVSGTATERFSFTDTGNFQATGSVKWGAGTSGMNSGNPRSLAIGYSGGNYGSAGYGINFTTTSNSHTYAIADIVSRWDAYDGLIVYAAPAGTVGASVSWTTVLDARRSNTSMIFNGKTVLDSSNYTSYVAGLGGGNYTGTIQVTQSGVVDAFKATNSSTTLTDESSIRFQKTMTPTGTVATNYLGGLKWEAKNSNGNAYDMVRIFSTNVTSSSLDAGNYAVGELNLVTYKYIGGYAETSKLRLSGGSMYWHSGGAGKLIFNSTQMYPNSDAAFDIGTSTYRMGTVYTTNLTFADGTTQTTAGGAPATISAIGSVILAWADTASTVFQGGTIAGSSLYSANTSTTLVSGGAWILMAGTYGASGSFYANRSFISTGPASNRLTSGNTGYTSPPASSGYSTYSGTWRLLSNCVTARSSYFDGYSNLTYSNMQLGMWVRIS